MCMKKEIVKILISQSTTNKISYGIEHNIKHTFLIIEPSIYQYNEIYNN